MARISILLAVLVWSAQAWAQNVPTANQWLALFKEVHQHPLFRDLEVAYTTVPVVNLGGSPVGVMPRDGSVAFPETASGKLAPGRG